MRNSVYTSGSVKEYFKNPSRRRSSTLKKSNAFRKVLLIMILMFILIGSSHDLLLGDSVSLQSPQVTEPECLWEICSIDTMKTSRDRARAELYNPGYDLQIQKQLELIKGTGASYVAVGTPYDNEFLPFLKRWVKLARENELKVYFRGNWSNWEGWFEYPKNMGPEEHLQKTTAFITSHPQLFQNGDIFDPCPECENAGFWPQPHTDQDYQEFIKKQQKNTQDAFKKINKQVKVHQSIIGGRVKDVISSQETFDSLGNIVGIDHYVKTPEGMESYIKNFSENFKSKTLVSEFGAPIPDMNGKMDPQDQAEFVESILETLYQQRHQVHGLNYWVLSEGTTAIVDDDLNPLPVYEILKKYFSPGKVSGTIINDLGEPLPNIQIKTEAQILAKTSATGFYSFPLPPRKIDIIVEAENFEAETTTIEITENNQLLQKNFTLKPKNPGIIYNLKLWFKDTF